MVYLENAVQYLQTTFPADWINPIAAHLSTDDIDDDTAVDDFRTELAGLLDAAAGKLFDDLNFSVIAGEYVQDLPKYRHNLDDIERLVREIAASMDMAGYPQMTLIGQELIQTNFHYWVKQAIKRYRSLIDFVTSHLVYQANTSEILYVLRKDGDQPGESAAKELYEIFQINIEMARIDHSISFEKETFTDLILMLDQLKHFSSASVAAGLLNKKCEFLLYKISFRLKESQKNYLYAIDFNYVTVQPTPVTEFADYTAIINGHYDNGFDPPDYETRRKEALQKLTNPATLELGDYHALIKYFKDDKKDLERLQQLRTVFKQYRDRLHPTASLYDQKALDIAFCYLENNVLSLELQQKKLTVANWKGKLKEYTDRADHFQNNNFFPYYKIVKEFLSGTIKEQFFLENYDLAVIDQLIKDFKDNLEKLRKNLGICEETDYLSYQSDFAGCITLVPDTNATPWPCFLSSSFVLPLNYKEYFEEFEQFKAELYQFQSMYEIQKMIDKDRKSVKEVKEEIQKTDKRHIEILSIFAALVLFVSNEIQIFTKIDNIANAAAFTFFFAFGLGLFVLMIWYITRPEGKKLKDMTFTHWFSFSFMSVGLIAAIIFIFKVGSPSENQKKLKDMDYRIDSAKKVKALQQIVLPKDTAKHQLKDTTKKSK